MTHHLALVVCACLASTGCGGPSADPPPAPVDDGGAGDSGDLPDTGVQPGARVLPCSADGFCWLHPRPVGFDLYDVWGASPDDVWVTGANGSLLHWDGSAWSWHRFDATDYILAVFGFAADDVWIVGTDGFVSHFDGFEWTQIEPASDGALHDIWGRSADDIWAVGDGGLALHYDGREWTRVDVGTDELLRAVHGRGDELFILGERTLLRRDDADFTTLYRSRSVTGGDDGGELVFTALHVAETGLVLAAHDSVLYRWVDGAPAEIEGTRQHFHNFHTLWSRGADLWAGGESDIVHVGADGAVTRFDPPDEVLGLYGWPSTGPMAVGQRGRVYRWDAERRSFDSDEWSGTRGVDSLYAPNDREAWGTGSRWSDANASVLHCLDDDCELVPLGSGESLTTIWGSADNVWGIGSAGTVFRFDGTIWGRPLPGPPARGRPLAIGGSGPDDVWIVGEHGWVMRFDGLEWFDVTSGTDRNLSAVWASAPDDVWIVGGYRSDDLVLHYDGEAISIVTDGRFGAELKAVTGTGPDDVWIGGNTVDSALIAHFDGTDWTRRILPRPSFRVYDLTSAGRGEAWVAAGALWRVDAETTMPAAVGATSLTSVAVGGTSIWAGGSSATMLRADGFIVE